MWSRRVCSRQRLRKRGLTLASGRPPTKSAGSRWSRWTTSHGCFKHLGKLGAPADWAAAPTYNSVALATIDSIWSIGVRYGGVLNVLERYRTLRRAQGRDPETDTPADLVRFIESLGGAEAFGDAVKNRQRTLSKNGILKAEAVLQQTRMLAVEGVSSPQDIATADPELLERLRWRWTGEVVGQASGPCRGTTS